ncbi:mitochondrial import inner membrane translocase subunit TIM50-like [Haliotis cracherodii]|uniref:mitochondrial import inner membrane translocase subunit TIM50-like n=1 Tax=Haliotis cracherodii TaxID=6455 RepID=UPI0039EB78B1
MAAYSACMCFVQRCHLLKKSVSLVTVYNTRQQCLHSQHLTQRKIIPTQSSIVLLYSTKQSDNVKGLTDEILKAKILAEKSKVEGSSDNKTNSEKSKEEDSKQSRWSRWTGKNAWKLGLGLLGGWAVMTVGGFVHLYGAPPRDPDGNIVEDEFSKLSNVEAHMRRAAREVSVFRKTIQDPSRDKLLPDPLEYPYVQPPYTLVLEMTGVLVHPDWTYGTGWRFKKRPGIEYFLQQVGPPMFEIVIYTSEQGMTADPLINNLDPNGFVMYRLYRDATRYLNGHHVKDLSCLNRDLSKVIVIDWNNRSYQLNPANAFPIKKWSGSDEDRDLIDLAHFLRALASSGVEDIRPVMEYYSQFDNPLEMFKENQRKLQAEQEKQLMIQQDQQKKKVGSWGLNPFRR